MRSGGGPDDPGSPTVLFYRHFRKFRGGHLKVWDYFNHVRAAPGFEARVAFSQRSEWGEANPWREVPELVVSDPAELDPAAFFVAGRDWSAVDSHPAWGPRTPVLNLVQHVRHADPESDRYQFLARPAIRICVSEEVRSAIAATGLPRGPMLVIREGLDLERLPPPRSERDIDVLVAGLKRPELAASLAGSLGRAARVEALTDHVPRHEFLDRLARAHVTVFLPNPTEGFYLPALEGMALGTLVVCPDCVGNRSFCLPARNCVVPAYDESSLEAAASQARETMPTERERMLASARHTAEAHSLMAERRTFHDVLARLGELWSEASKMPATTRE